MGRELVQENKVKFLPLVTTMGNVVSLSLVKIFFPEEYSNPAGVKFCAENMSDERTDGVNGVAS
jgi:hypothetical protein